MNTANTILAVIILVLILLIPLSYWYGTQNQRLVIERDTIRIPYQLPPVMIQGETKYKLIKIHDTVVVVDTVRPEFDVIATYNRVIDSLRSLKVGIIAVFDTINRVTNDTIIVHHDVISDYWHLSMRFSERSLSVPRDIIYVPDKRRWYEEPWLVGTVAFVSGFLISRGLNNER